ncbi:MULTISPECIES: hypothetical protein [Arcobacteraceae]|uniref:hypothetical protein n=1 Tax=Arcobacteraceae TaxID=2808963 RepID=UPI0021B36BDF|nr:MULTISPECIES: hypothetical protein [Arcobacteraceae]MCT7633900.1 hypothetical protein [Aliarcobacter butzleri]MCT7643448.1 hypothetical protein [Aliarcobacter butzleri]MCT7911675.1 hypothetical protein [Arcobacter lacus]
MKKSKNLKNILAKYYSVPMINRILRGERKPSYEMMLTLEKEHNIPFCAWQDIESFISKNIPNNKNKKKVCEEEK